MISTSYSPYLQLSLSHLYYQQRNCPDIFISPTASCSRLLEGHRCLLKGSQNRLVVLIPVEAEKTPIVPLDPSLVLTFELALRNPDFLSYTELKSDFRLGETIYRYSNKSIKKTKASRGKGSQHIVLNDNNIEPFSVVDKSPGESQVLGLIDLYINQFPPFRKNRNKHKSQEYVIEFTPQSKHWWYYLIVGDGVDDESFSIADKQGKLKFKQVDELPFNYGQKPIHARFPHSKAVLFRSENPIQCGEQVISGLQLLKKSVPDRDGSQTDEDKESDSSAAQVWIESLPNPSMRNGVQVINLLKNI